VPNFASRHKAVTVFQPGGIGFRNIRVSVELGTGSLVGTGHLGNCHLGQAGGCCVFNARLPDRFADLAVLTVKGCAFSMHGRCLIEGNCNQRRVMSVWLVFASMLHQVSQ